MRPWTVGALERECRKALMDPALSVRLTQLDGKEAAYIEWAAGDKARVVVDPHEMGVKPALIHELLHHVLSDDVGDLEDDLEEALVLAWEDVLTRHVNRSRYRVRWWREAIRRKVRGARAEA